MEISASIVIFLCLIYVSDAHLPFMNSYINVQFAMRSNKYFESSDINFDLLNMQLYQRINKDLGYFTIVPSFHFSVRNETNIKSLKTRVIFFNLVNRIWLPPDDSSSFIYHRFTFNGLNLDNSGFPEYYKKWINLGYEFGIRTKGENYVALSLGPYLAISSIKFSDNYYSNFDNITNKNIFGFDTKLQSDMIISTKFFRLENLSSISRIYEDDNVNIYSSESQLRIPISKYFADKFSNSFDYSGFNLIISYRYEKFEIINNYHEFNEFSIGLNWRYYLYNSNY